MTHRTFLPCCYAELQCPFNDEHTDLQPEMLTGEKGLRPAYDMLINSVRFNRNQTSPSGENTGKFKIGFSMQRPGRQCLANAMRKNWIEVPGPAPPARGTPCFYQGSGSD